MDTTRARFSHYLGVSWNKQSQQWQARFHKPDGGSHLVGGFKEEEEAGQAYDEYALKHYGNGAVRNFPPSIYTGETGLVSSRNSSSCSFCLSKLWQYCCFLC